MTRPADPAVAALQAALAGEHAAVYGYAVIGGRVDGDSAVGRLAIVAHSQHRGVRDSLVEVLLGRAEPPIPADPGYELPAPVEGPPSARALARLLEDRCSVLHAAVVANGDGEARRLAAQALLDCAVRGLRWGAPATAFPGVGAA